MRHTYSDDLSARKAMSTIWNGMAIGKPDASLDILPYNGFAIGNKGNSLNSKFPIKQKCPF